jgi:hypothetical protein
MITQSHIETVLGLALANLGHPVCNAALWKEELGDTAPDEATIVEECERLLKLQNAPIDPWGFIRGKRNKLLADSDWTQLADAPLIPEQKQAWTGYRQALRDLPSAFATIEEVVWPPAPV